MFWVLIIALVPLSFGIKPCSDYGMNWAAEIRCLRNLLNQCREGYTVTRDARNIAVESLPVRSFARPPTHPHLHPFPPQVDTNAIYSNFTKLLEEKVEKLKLEMEQTMSKKINEIQTRYDMDLRSVEIRLERRIQDLERRFEKELRLLGRKVDLVSARAQKFRDQEYALMQDKESWYRAEEVCLQWGGHLASIGSVEENNFINGLLQSEPAWFGLNDVQLENVFVNTDRTPSNFRNWKSGQPDNENHNENCGEIHPGGIWKDTLCLLRRQFVCER